MSGRINGNGRAVTLAAVLGALMLLLGVLNGIPWASKTDVSALRDDLRRELSEIKTDVREIRNAIRGHP